MSKKILILLSGQLREFYRVGDNIAQNIAKIKAHQKDSKITVLLNVWDSSCSYFPARGIKSWVMEKDQIAGSSVVLHTWLQRLKLNGTVVDGYLNVVPSSSVPRPEITSVEHFRDVAWLNLQGSKKMMEIEERDGEKFDVIIKIRPDLVWSIDAVYQIFSVADMLSPNAIASIGGSIGDGNSFGLSGYYDGFEMFRRQSFNIYSSAFFSIVTGQIRLLEPSLHLWLKKYLTLNNIEFSSLPSDLHIAIARPKELFEVFSVELDASSAASLVKSYQKLDEKWMEYFKQEKSEAEINTILETLDQLGVKYETP